MSNIRLQSSDGEVFNVDLELISKCRIKTMVECLGKEENEKVVHLPHVNSLILNKIIQWLTHHKDDPPTPEVADDISPWDIDFLKVNQEILLELIVTANYLDIKSLRYVTSKTAVNIMKGKTPEEIRETFNIENDEEEEKLRDGWW